MLRAKELAKELQVLSWKLLIFGGFWNTRNWWFFRADFFSPKNWNQRFFVSEQKFKEIEPTRFFDFEKFKEPELTVL